MVLLPDGTLVSTFAAARWKVKQALEAQRDKIDIEKWNRKKFTSFILSVIRCNNEVKCLMFFVYSTQSVSCAAVRW